MARYVRQDGARTAWVVEERLTRPSHTHRLGHRLIDVCRVVLADFVARAVAAPRGADVLRAAGELEVAAGLVACHLQPKRPLSEDSMLSVGWPNATA